MIALKLPIYLDNHSTTKVDPRVVEAMLPYFTDHYGNAASKHHEFGWKAEAAVENARRQVAALVGCDAKEVVFTSGATESINLALKGIAGQYASKGNHIITAATEHKAVLDTCERLKQAGFSVTYLPVDRTGRVDPDDVERAFTRNTILVSIMMANNEIGTVAPIAEIASICRERGITFHTDATQAVGKIPLDFRTLGIGLMSFSAHKMYGPKGVGALCIRSSNPAISLAPQMDGGGHERGFRSGTLNVPAIVGFGKAAEIAREEVERDRVRIAALRSMLEDGIRARLDDVSVNGHSTERLPNNTNLTFHGVKADRLIMDMKDIAVSTGSACSSSLPEPSHVLRAIGLTDDDVLSSIRFGLGRFTSADEIEYTIHRVVQTVKTIREKSLHLTLH